MDDDELATEDRDGAGDDEGVDGTNELVGSSEDVAVEVGAVAKVSGAVAGTHDATGASLTHDEAGDVEDNEVVCAGHPRKHTTQKSPDDFIAYIVWKI